LPGSGMPLRFTTPHGSLPPPSCRSSATGLAGSSWRMPPDGRWVRFPPGTRQRPRSLRATRISPSEWKRCEWRTLPDARWA